MKSPHVLVTTALMAVSTSFSSLAAEGRVVNEAVPTPAKDGKAWYPTRKAPLQPAPFLKLPVGAVKPKGWLKTQLELQSKGFHGRLTEISTFLKKDGNSWLSPDGQGKFGWEEVPYWLKGFGDCAYLLNNEEQIKEAKIWIEGAIKSQTADGFFGPRGNGAKATVESTQGEWDLWPNMPMMDSLRSYYEFTNDPRVLDLLAKYFRWQLKLDEQKFIPPYWQQMRAYDNLWSVLWLYDRTEDPTLQADLRAFADKIQRRVARWDTGIVNWHNVNVLEGFGGPAFYWPFSGKKELLDQPERNFQEFRTKFGQMPGGLFGADEIARPGYTDPRQAVETCGMVEFMFSCERLLQTTGQSVWGDRCEDVAFNQLPAATTSDLRGLRYLTACNMATATGQSHNPGIMNGGPMFLMDPRDHRCCQHNFGHGWPYLTQYVWMATPGGGAALMFPLASEATVKVGPEGQPVQLITETNYPFSGQITIRVKTPKPVAFPLVVRVPNTAFAATFGPAGSDEGFPVVPGQYATATRTWSDGEAWVLDLIHETTITKWKENKNSQSIHFGPLTFSLNIKQKTTKIREKDEWPATEITPDGAWNYGLVATSADKFHIERRPMPPDGISPWTSENIPLQINAKGRKIPEWQLDRHGLVDVLQKSPAKTKEKEEDIQLIPMGAARIRITAFPTAAEGKDATQWKGPPTQHGWKVTASHCYDQDRVDAVKDAIEPKSSSDESIPRFTFWTHKGTSEWVEIDFGSRRKVSGVEIYWFDDGAKGGCRLPQSWNLQRKRSTGAWVTPEEYTQSAITKDGWNEASFKSTETNALRFNVQLQPEWSAGILEIRLK